MTENFGEYLRRLRTAKGYTLTQLAAKIGIDSANLSKIETGKRDLDEKKLQRVAKVFNLDINGLKEEYFSDKIARKLFENHCSEKTLILAEQKIKYIKQKKSTQGNIEF